MRGYLPRYCCVSRFELHVRRPWYIAHSKRHSRSILRARNIPLENALDLNFPFKLDEKQLEEPLLQSHASAADSSRLLVAVTTACCQHISMSRRNSIRDTWLLISRATTPNVDVTFFLAQARNSSVLEWLPMLQVEVSN